MFKKKKKNYFKRMKDIIYCTWNYIKFKIAAEIVKIGADNHFYQAKIASKKMDKFKLFSKYTKLKVHQKVCEFSSDLCKTRIKNAFNNQ